VEEPPALVPAQDSEQPGKRGLLRFPVGMAPSPLGQDLLELDHEVGWSLPNAPIRRP